MLILGLLFEFVLDGPIPDGVNSPCSLSANNIIVADNFATDGPNNPSVDAPASLGLVDNSPSADGNCINILALTIVNEDTPSINACPVGNFSTFNFPDLFLMDWKHRKRDLHTHPPLFCQITVCTKLKVLLISLVITFEQAYDTVFGLDDEVDLCSDIYRSISMYVYEHRSFGDLITGVTGKALALHEEVIYLLFGLPKVHLCLLPFPMHSVISNFSLHSPNFCMALKLGTSIQMIVACKLLI